MSERDIVPSTEACAELIDRDVEWMKTQPDHLRPSDAFIDGFAEAAVHLRDAREDDDMSTRDEVERVIEAETWRREGRCEGCGAYFKHKPDCPGDSVSRLATAEQRVADLEAGIAEAREVVEDAIGDERLSYGNQGDYSLEDAMTALRAALRALVGDETPAHVCPTPSGSKDYSRHPWTCPECGRAYLWLPLDDIGPYRWVDAEPAGDETPGTGEHA